MVCRRRPRRRLRRSRAIFREGGTPPPHHLWFANHKKDGLFGFGNQNNHDFYGFKTNNNMANITDIRKYKKVTRYKNVV